MDEIIEPEKVKASMASSSFQPLKTVKRPFFHTPWLSLITSVILILYLFATSTPQVLQNYEFVKTFLSPQIRTPLLVVFFTIYLFDFYLLKKSQKKIKARLISLDEQLELAWKQKAKQQARANTYSGQTDKLKGFISDKLLEFMEFDEKFVHFKGIASEVRHNGVISFDKVMSALKKAIEQQGFLSIYEQNKQENDDNEQLSSQTLNAMAQYQDAQDAMEYLWALLDLSTADNMAIHIGNQLIECEEHYFQLQLDAEKSMDITQSIPVSPTFYPQLSLLLTLSLLSNEQEIRNMIALSRINHRVFEEPIEFCNEQFSVYAEATDELLGNYNHIILLLENLIKNALFFSRKTPYKQSADKVVIRLFNETSKNITFSVYNRGPHIGINEMENIFTLGYSTRRNHKHNGKGLGLFFGRQIIDGYQGEIKVENIATNASKLIVKLVLTNGEELCHEIESIADNGRPQCRLAEEKFTDKVQLNSVIPVKTLIFCLADTSSEQFDLATEDLTMENLAMEDYIYNEEKLPVWQFNFRSSKKSSSLILKALDTTGVQFKFSLPSASSLLEE
ncbi:sensor histidine kinase [Aliikangiella sp. G2MR2-5]|uniref:ATP-binding protein n=1 Tax=Aliikangiella sp. G2MR2-5 TaxID=2788943 RepID=UPI0018AB73DF|nr:ATP-binding protein [Aliikangiella sp. G2MR2-5]